jgi:glycosyltransferase involved in cell wall biosynthesis
MKGSRLRVAFIGTRGVPARYSGFETCAEQLGRRLAARGHGVTVYCRSHFDDHQGAEYLGMRRITLPSVRQKYFDTIVHACLSTLHALGTRYDVILYFIAGNSPLVWIPRLVGTKTVINVDGLDWKRDKWPAAARQYLRLSEWLAPRLANACITDSTIVQAYYRDSYGRDTVYIPYGSELDSVAAGPTLARFGLEAGHYVLFVGRLVEENCVHHLVEAFRSMQTSLRCVIVGGASYAGRYAARLRDLAEGDSRITFTGYLFGEGYRELASNAAVFVETSGVGGTHPALVEAMAFGRCVIVNDTPENLETIGTAGRAYSGQEGAPALAALLQRLLADEKTRRALGAAAAARAREHYAWDAVTDAYERLFVRTIDG